MLVLDVFKKIRLFLIILPLFLSCIKQESVNKIDSSNQIINKEHSVLRVAGELFPPYLFLENGEVKGIDVDIAKIIFSRLGVEIKIEVLPWKRLWSNMETGLLDVSFATSIKEKRKPYVYYPKNHVWDSSYHFLTYSENFKKYGSMDYKIAKEKNLIIGIIAGNSYHQSFWDIFPSGHPSLEQASNIERNLIKLSKKRIDLYIIDRTVGLYTAKTLGLNNIMAFDEVLFSKPYPSAFSKLSKFKNDKFPNIKFLMDAYDKELEALKKTDEYQAIFIKWTGN